MRLQTDLGFCLAIRNIRNAPKSKSLTCGKSETSEAQPSPVWTSTNWRRIGEKVIRAIAFISGSIFIITLMWSLSCCIRSPLINVGDVARSSLSSSQSVKEEHKCTTWDIQVLASSHKLCCLDFYQFYFQFSKWMININENIAILFIALSLQW